MTPLLPEQRRPRELRDVCETLAIDLVVIGATALRVWIPDAQRLTEDVDVAVALDLDGFGPLTARLSDLGWNPDDRWEPRWHSRGHARVDLLPIGLRAREEKQIRWPRVETVMRVVGYDGVFRHAVRCELAADLDIRVAPLHVLALLKLIAYLDAPALRQKDVGDLLLILDKYEDNGDRRFSDDPFDAGIGRRPPTRPGPPDDVRGTGGSGCRTAIPAARHGSRLPVPSSSTESTIGRRWRSREPGRPIARGVALGFDTTT